MQKLNKQQASKMKLKELLHEFRDELTKDLIESTMNPNYDQDYIRNVMDWVDNIIDCCKTRNKF